MTDSIVHSLANAKLPVSLTATHALTPDAEKSPRHLRYRSHGLMVLWDVPTADSRLVHDSQDDISKPGAQQRGFLRIDLCQCKNIHANSEVDVNADYAVLADDVTGSECAVSTNWLEAAGSRVSVRYPRLLAVSQRLSHDGMKVGVEARSKVRVGATDCNIVAMMLMKR
jgi:hypothetical protein